MAKKRTVHRYFIVSLTPILLLLTCIPRVFGQPIADHVGNPDELPCSSYFRAQPTQYKVGNVVGKEVKFTMDEHDALLLLPEKTRSASPLGWVWFAPMVPGEPNEHHEFIIQHVLSAGMAFASIDVGESYGSVDGTRLYAEFHDLLNRCFDLSRRAVLLPQSRGGLMLFNWAALHSDEVVRVVGIYPVCDLRSYPGLAIASKAYGMTEQELVAQLKQHNPVDLLSALAKAHVPVLLIHGNNDNVVPLQENAAEFVRRYRSLGGSAKLILVQDRGHEEVDEFLDQHHL